MMRLTEISNSGVLALDFIGDTENGDDWVEGGGHELAVDDFLVLICQVQLARLAPRKRPRRLHTAGARRHES